MFNILVWLKVFKIYKEVKVVEEKDDIIEKFRMQLKEVVSG